MHEFLTEKKMKIFKKKSFVDFDNVSSTATFTHTGTVISMESASLCWILDDEEVTTNTENVDDKPTPDGQKKKNQLEDTAGGDNFLGSSDDACGCLNGSVISMNTFEMEEQQSTKKSSHTLANINFKIKKGTNLFLFKLNRFIFL